MRVSQVVVTSRYDELEELVNRIDGSRRIGMRFLTLSAGAILAIGSLAMPMSAAAADNSISVGPATTTISPAGSTGGTFTVDITANGSMDISGAGAALDFDNTRLQLTALAKDATEVGNGVTYAGFPTPANTTTFIAGANSAGEIPTIAWTYTDGSSAEPASTDVGIFNATFEVIAAGDSSIDPVVIPGVGGLLDGSSDNYGNSLSPITLNSGSVVNTASGPTVPGAPTGVTATRGDASALVSWTAPNDGGSAILGYTATAEGGSEHCTTTTATSCTVGGLTNGVAFTFDVTATNDQGTGPAGTSNSVTPAAVPGAPTGVTATRGNGSATVSWTAPASNGSTITAYTVTSTPGPKTCGTTGAFNCTVNGLTNGQPYTFKVVATNDVGAGPASTASNSVTPATVPGAPTAVKGVGFNLSALISWSAPASNGGSAVTSYTVTSSPSSKTCTTTALSCTVSGLVNKTAYTFTVEAANSVGAGSASAASSSVTPRVGSTFVPLVPSRIVDSHAKVGLAAHLTANVAATFTVVGRAATDSTRNVPTNATAVTGVLTVLNATAAGSLTLNSTATNAPTTVDLTFPKADTRSTGVTEGLGTGGKLSITYKAASGSSADVYFDVTGYFVLGTSGSTYVSLTPNAVVDTRTKTGLSAKLTAGTAKTFTVTGRHPTIATENVPTTATAVTGILTVINPGAAGRLYLGPTALAAPTTTDLNFPKADTRATSLTVKIGTSGVLALTYTAAAGATTDVTFVVTGYFIPGTSGATYVPLTPNRIVNSATAVGVSSKLTASVARSFAVTGRVPSTSTKNVPIGSVAVTGTLTSSASTATGSLALTTAANNHPTIPYLDFPKADTRSSCVTVAITSTGVLYVTYVGSTGATTQISFDVTGYFVK